MKYTHPDQSFYIISWHSIDLNYRFLKQVLRDGAAVIIFNIRCGYAFLIWLNESSALKSILGMGFLHVILLAHWIFHVDSCLTESPDF